MIYKYNKMGVLMDDVLKMCPNLIIDTSNPNKIYAEYTCSHAEMIGKSKCLGYKCKFWGNKKTLN